MTVTLADDGDCTTSKRVVPPINFSLVAPGVYRSGHPNHKNFGFLRELHLKGIMYVEGSGEYRKDGQDLVDSSNITLHRFDLSSKTDLFSSKGREILLEALKVVLDTRNHPLLIHDDSGKSTCTLLCSLIRRIQGWSLTGIFAEGDMFAGPAGGSEGGGVGEAGREFIALFDPFDVQVDPTFRPTWALRYERSE